MRKILIIVQLMLSIVIYGQSQYAHSLLDTLCSPFFHGRGYYEKGDSLAAKFIADEMNAIGLQSFRDDLLQPFSISTNVVRGLLEVSVDKKLLIAGIDYIVSPASPSVKGTFNTLFLAASDTTRSTLVDKLKKANDHFIVISDDTHPNKNTRAEIIQQLMFSKSNIGGILLITKDSLIYSASSVQAPNPLITIRSKAIDHLPKKISVTIQAQFHEAYQSQNVIGYIKGQVSDTFLCVTAHYDHLGRMGDKVYFPGANDNASGVAMMLSLAKHFQQMGVQPKYSLAFMAFGAEEIGILGSKYYTEHPFFPLGNIKFLINLDILGTGDEGIQVVNSTIYKDAYQKLNQINVDQQYLTQVKTRGERCNSDHCFFHEEGVPSFFIYTLGGIGHYHSVWDQSNTLPLTAFDNLMKLLTDFIDNF